MHTLVGLLQYHQLFQVSKKTLLFCCWHSRNWWAEFKKKEKVKNTYVNDSLAEVSEHGQRRVNNSSVFQIPELSSRCWLLSRLSRCGDQVDPYLKLHLRLTVPFIRTAKKWRESQKFLISFNLELAIFRYLLLHFIKFCFLMRTSASQLWPIFIRSHL